MKQPIPDRRRNRSYILQRALELQLQETAERCRCHSLVLADGMGLVVVSVGDQEHAEELAALSPLLAGGGEVWQGEVDTGEESVDVSVAPVLFEDGLLYLTASGGSRSRALGQLFHAGRGVSRILS